MSLNSIISTSLSGLFANQTALRATSNNIANVNTENYARVRAQFEANVSSGTSAGVKVADVSRVVDQFLETALRTATSNASEFTAQREFHDRLQGILGDPTSKSSLSSRIDRIFKSVADLTLSPADVLRRQQTLSELQNFLDQSSLFQAQLQNLRGEASQQLSENVEAINENLQRIKNLNPLLVSQRAAGADTGGLEGQLSSALSDLAELIDIKVDRQPSGAVYVSTSNGYPLVDTGLSQLTYSAPGIVSADTVFPSIKVSRVNALTLEPTSTPADLTPNIRSGKLAGLLEMRDRQLPALATALGELGARVADEFNKIQNTYSAAPPPNTLTGRQTIVDGSQALNFTGEVTFAVVDGDNKLQAKVTVDFDAGGAPATFNDLVTLVNGASGLNGAGTLSLVDGVMTLDATAAGNGVAIVDTPGNPSQRAGRGFSHFFGMNDLVTASKQGIYETGVTSTQAHGITAGETINFRVTDSNSRELTTVTVTVSGTNTTYGDMLTELNSVTGLGAYFSFSLDSDGALQWTEKTGYDGAKLQVVSDNTEIANTGVSFSQAFGVGDSFRIDAAKDLQIKSTIQNDPNLLALSVFDLSGAVNDVVLTNGDQRGALAFQDLETSLVEFGDAGELQATSVTLSQYVSRFLGNAGLQAARATNFEEDNLALQEEVGQRNSDVSGVNLDEELANLVVYQNAYNAAARILSSVQQLYDTLLQAV